jgi:hypothetical protein
MRPPENRDEAFYVVNKTIAAMRTQLNKGLDVAIPHGAFNSVMNKVMREMYPPKKRAGKKRNG